MSKKPRVVGLPLRYELGRELKVGQDNTVYTLVESNTPPHLRDMSVGLVAKVNHDRRNLHNAHTEAHADAKEAAMRGVLYKKHAYELLQAGLGEAIPESHFILAQAHQGREGAKRYVELTVQRDIGRTSLNSMPAERRSGALRRDVSDLLCHAGILLSAVEIANEEVAPKDRINLRVDVGVRNLSGHSPVECDELAVTTRTPNILVAPDDTAYYVDFGQGQWHEGMLQTKEYILEQL